MDRQTILSALLVLAVGATGVVWFMFLRAPSSAPESEIITERNSDPELLRWRQLKNLIPDTTILQSNLYKNLTRFASATSTIKIESKRYNPFEPL